MLLIDTYTYCQFFSNTGKEISKYRYIFSYRLECFDGNNRPTSPCAVRSAWQVDPYTDTANTRSDMNCEQETNVSVISLVLPIWNTTALFRGCHSYSPNSELRLNVQFALFILRLHPQHEISFISIQ